MVSFAERLWEKIDARGADECWPWLAGKHKGYGRLRKFVDGKWTHTSAAKAVWEECHGQMPEGHEPDHTCCDPGCCHPNHIEAVSHSENMKRLWRRGRGRTGVLYGSRQGRAKFTPEQVAAVRADARGSAVLGQIYGVHRKTIEAIKARRTYRYHGSGVIDHPVASFNAG